MRVLTVQRWIAWVCVASGLLFAGPVGAQATMGQINVNGQLVMAARAGQLGRVQALLADGAAVNSRDRHGDTPLNLAAGQGNVALLRVLLDAHADVDLANLAGVTPLMSASFASQSEMVRLLLSAGAHADALDRVDKSAAVYAAGQGCTACLEALLGPKPQVNVTGARQLTLLMWAAAYGRRDTVAFLLSQGADRRLKDQRGKTAWDMARDENQVTVLDLLKPDGP